jgi:hypothetical protein
MTYIRTQIGKDAKCPASDELFDICRLIRPHINYTPTARDWYSTNLSEAYRRLKTLAGQTKVLERKLGRSSIS